MVFRAMARMIEWTRPDLLTVVCRVRGNPTHRVVAPRHLSCIELIIATLCEYFVNLYMIPVIKNTFLISRGIDMKMYLLIVVIGRAEI